jgi:hypothetical protein
MPLLPAMVVAHGGNPATVHEHALGVATDTAPVPVDDPNVVLVGAIPNVQPD